MNQRCLQARPPATASATAAQQPGALRADTLLLALASLLSLSA